MRFIKWIAPIGRFFGLLPVLTVFNSKQLQDAIKNAGFNIDYQWHPENSQAVFIIAIKST